jgi:hypothetical protein
MPFRPKSLREIAEQASTLEAWGFALAEFLDEVNARRKAGELDHLARSVADEPPLLAGRFEFGDAADAFGAALAEYLAASCSFAAPAWTRAPARFLCQPWWPLPRMAEHPELQAWIEAHTPFAFREHNIYIDENSLVRV